MKELYAFKPPPFLSNLETLNLIWINHLSGFGSFELSILPVQLVWGLRFYKERTRISWSSPHLSFFEFAFLSLQESKESGTNEIYTNDTNLNKKVIETILYSFTCLEASINYIHEMGQKKTVRSAIKSPIENWDSIKSVGKRLETLSSEINMKFWEYYEQEKLFHEFRILRNSLVHIAPVGIMETSKILEEIKYNNGSTGTLSRPIGTPILTETYIDREWSAWVEKRKWKDKNPIANFKKSPFQLDKEDAEKAFEILLHHLIRMADLFLYKDDSFVGIYDKENSDILTAKKIKETINCRFEKDWSL